MDKSKDITRIIIIYLLFAIGILAIYRTNQIVSLAYFALVYIFLFLRKDVFLVYGFALLLLDSPGGVFVESTIDYAYRLPFISFGAGATIGAVDIFMVMLIFFAGTKKVIGHPLQREIRVYVAFGLLVFLYSLALGMASSYLVMLLRFAITYVAMYRLLGTESWNEEKIKTLTNITIAIFLLAFVNHISELYLNTSIMTIFAGSRGGLVFRESMFGREGLGGVRIISSPYVNLISVMLIFRKIMRQEFRLSHVVILVLCYLSIFLSATRGWIISYSIMYLIIFTAAMGSGRMDNVAKLIIPIAISLMLVVSLNLATGNVIYRQLNSAWQRLNTVSYMLEGDLEAGETVGRLTYTSDAVLDSWRENPILGWGFSIYSRPDGHVGNQNILQTYGLVGFLIIYALVLFFIAKNYRYWSRYRQRENIAYISIMVGLLIINASSRQMLGYDPRGNQRVVFTLFILLVILSANSMMNTGTGHSGSNA